MKCFCSDSLISVWWWFWIRFQINTKVGYLDPELSYVVGGWLLDALQTFSKEDVNKVVCVDLFGHPSFWKHWKVSYSVWSSLKKLFFFFFFPYGPLFLIHPWRFVGLPSRVQTPPGRGKIQCIVWSPQPKHRDWWSLMSLLHFSIYILSEETETLAILN